MKKLKIIVAFQESDYGIGKNNIIPWEPDKEDMNLFKSLTVNNKIVMGRKTWESLPKKPLPNRNNIVLTSCKDLNAPNICSLILIPQQSFIIGGAMLYQKVMESDLVDTIYASIFKHTYDCDVFFPKIDMTIWEEFAKIEFTNFTFKTFIKR